MAPAGRLDRGFADDGGHHLSPPPRRGVTLGRVLGVLAILTAFGAAGWVAWVAYREQPAPVIAVDVPLITADLTPIKERPEDPGGMRVLDQDKTIYEILDGNDGLPVIERLLPPPEEPIDKPMPPIESAETGQGAGDEVAITDESETPVAQPEEAPESPPQSGSEPEVAAAPTPAVEVETPSPESDLPAAEIVAEPEGLDSVEAAAESGMPSSGLPLPEVPTSEAPVSDPAAEEPTAGEVASEAVESPQVPDVAEAPREEPPAEPAAVARDAPADAAFGIQLASFRTVESAESEWRRLSGMMPDLLAARTPRFERADLGEQGIYFRLRVPVGGREATEALCRDVRERGAGCIVVGF